MERSGITVLVVDDEDLVRVTLARLLAAEGYATVEAASGREALEVLAKREVGLMLTDVRMPGMDGIELLRRAKAVLPELEVIVTTAYATVESAVEAMRLGARDYLAKPVDRIELMLRVARALRERVLVEENRSLRAELRRGFDVGKGAHLIGSSESMRAVFDTVAQVAQNRSNVLIQGETGTGKELVARAIHASGPRAERPFVALNCGSVSRSLLESQLFGHVRGAFTGAVKDSPGFFVAADGGTLFLDEITEVDTEIQVRLLRAVQEREVTPVGGTKPTPVDVRIVAATNRDARRAVEEGAFRQDLYFRLAVVVIDLPPLRERPEDVRSLVDYFNRRLSDEYGVSPKTVSDEAMRLLQAYAWPGNVRELENVVERAFALGQGPAIGPGDLPPGISAATSASSAGPSARAGSARPSETAATASAGPTASPPGPRVASREAGVQPGTLAEGERAAIVRALESCGGNKVRAAEALGIPRKRLYRLLHKHGLMSAG